jgi:hypothetical protein
MRRFPPPWTVEEIPGGLKVVDANGQSLAYVYFHEGDLLHIATGLTENEARRTSPNCQPYSAKETEGWGARAGALLQ